MAWFLAEVHKAGPQPGEGPEKVAVLFQALDGSKWYGWRYPVRMHAEVLATALTAIASNLKVEVFLSGGDEGDGNILAMNVHRR